MNGRSCLIAIQALTQGGSERQAALSALSLRRRGWDCHVAIQRPGGPRQSELERGGVPIHLLPLRSLRADGPREAARLFHLIREHRFSVVHAFDTPSNMLAVPVARAAGAPLVLSSQRAHRSLSGRLRTAWLRASDRLSHGVVVNCQYLVDHLKRDEGVKAGKIHLCYNGLDTTLFSREGPVVKLPFPARSTVIGTVCALRPEKNLFMLVDAFAQLTESFPQVRLLMVGSGPEREGLEARATQLGIRSLVHFEPSVADTAVWLRAIDLFVLPSRSEAFSNALMEAMACGAVPIASEVGGNPELAAPGRGFLFPADDARALAALLQRLLHDTAQCAAVRAEAERWVRSELSLDHMADRLEEIYATAGRRQ